MFIPVWGIWTPVPSHARKAQHHPALLVTLFSLCTFPYEAFPGVLPANSRGWGWHLPSDVCVLLSAQDSPEQAGAGGARGQLAGTGTAARKQAGTRKVTPPGLLGTGNCADVVPFETFVKSSNERGSAPLPPGHSGGGPSCPVMPGDALPSCLGLSPPRGRCFGDSFELGTWPSSTAGGDTRQLRGFGASKRPRPHGPVPPPHGASAQHDITHGADAGCHIPASSLEVQRSPQGSIPLRHPKRREVWQLETRQPAGSWGSLNPRAPRVSLQGAWFAYRALVPPKRSRPRGRIWFQEHQ